MAPSTSTPSARRARAASGCRCSSGRADRCEVAIYILGAT
eukprot:CAMPEP_0170272996 /NCGR_PEP_ID=MMETSP0116_2-20130129/36459_1 /TAXON_ID=400756 /ORGANISM="Durinskia baltica, Strain CSIRO CS-38" /LENGTH=39 /DNA_ID= /DNA_START= /DNA_END= /DNA_ORIENTATION=